MFHLQTQIQAYEKLIQDRKYFPTDLKFEGEILARFYSFLESAGHKAFDRDYTPGHITGSALVTTPGFDKVLLTHHRKLGKWLQLGGHSDGDANTLEVARREIQEESSLGEFEFYRFHLDHTLPFDFDIHEIPARGDMPAHFHYDVRFLVVATGNLNIQISEESTDLQWFPLEQAKVLNPEPSMQRQFEKLAWFRDLAHH